MLPLLSTSVTLVGHMNRRPGTGVLSGAFDGAFEDPSHSRPPPSDQLDSKIDKTQLTDLGPLCRL